MNIQVPVETLAEVITLLHLAKDNCSCSCGGFEGGELAKQPCDFCDRIDAVLGIITSGAADKA